MTFDDFINKYDGKGIDYDGAYGFQCVDVIQQYSIEVLGIGPWGSGNAVGRWEDYPRKHFDRIVNTPEGIPQKGDVMIWGKGAGPYGHIAIFIEGTAGSFRSFDQNWPVGSLCHIQGHYYNNVIGWLHPKGDNMEWYKATNEPNVYKYDPDFDVYYGINDPNKVPWDKVKPVRPPGTYLVPYSNECQNALNACEKRKNELTRQNGELVGDVSKLKTALEDCSVSRDECIVKRDALQKQIDNHTCEVKELTAWEHFKLFISKLIERK